MKQSTIQTTSQNTALLVKQAKSRNTAMFDNLLPSETLTMYCNKLSESSVNITPHFASFAIALVGNLCGVHVFG